MATRNLTNLAKASGYSGAAGQSFRNNALGAGTGVRMTDYIANGWSSFSGDPSYPTIHQSGEVFRISWNAMDAGIKFPLISPMTTHVSIQDIGADPAPAEILAFHEKADAGDNWWVDVKLHGKAGSPANYSDITFQLQWGGDAFGFNDALIHQFVVRIVNRGTIGGGGGYPPEYMPLSLSIQDNGDGSATGSWLNTNQAGGVSTRVVWQSWNGSVWTTFSTVTVGNGVASHTQGGIASGTVVRFQAIYTNANGDSSWGYATSGQVTVTGGGGSPPTDTPSSVSLSNTGGGNGRASWGNTNNSLQIEVQFYKDSETYGSPVQLAAGSTQTDKAYPSGSEGTVDVYYFNGAGAGPAGSGGPAFF